MSSVKQIGDYTLGHEVGKGSFGTVNIAKNKNNESFAIKTISLSLIDQSGLRIQLKREISILRRMDHPNVVRLIDVLRNKHYVYLITEYVDGGDLFDLLSSKGQFTEAEARPIFEQIVTGVSYCHSLNIISRDMKVENVLLTKDHQVKICDFGFAQICDDGKFMETVCGTPNYLPPEILRHEPYTAAVDVYSSIVILFHMCAGRLPFDEDSNDVMFNKICKMDYVMPSHFSTELKDLVERGFKINGADRIKLTEVQDHAWLHMKDVAFSAVVKSPSMTRKQTLPNYSSAETFQVQDLFDATRRFRKY